MLNTFDDDYVAYLKHWVSVAEKADAVTKHNVKEETKLWMYEQAKRAAFARHASWEQQFGKLPAMASTR